MKLEAREQGMMELIEAYRAECCRRLIDNAQAKADAMLAEVYARQRGALHRRILAERSRATGLIQAADAERATRARRAVEARDDALIELAWPRLRQALARRWQDRDGRCGWIDAALNRALQRLQRVPWWVRFAQPWPVAERDQVRRRIEQATGQPCDLRADADLSARILFGCAGARLDASIDGLLHERAAIEARVLALWHRRPVVDGPGAEDVDADAVAEGGKR